MAKYIVEGGGKLSGKVKISGNKNSVLPCIAAALLTQEEVVLKNVPAISDVKVMIDLISDLGAEVSYSEDELRIKAEKIRHTKLSSELMTKLRASILLIGPLLSRCGRVEFTHPGGDVIGKRSIEPHIQGFRQLGYAFNTNDRDYKVFKARFIKRDEVIFLEEPTVTGTENLVLASVTMNGSVTIKDCALEPHVVDLCNLLNLMGAKIEGIGTTTLRIEGVKKLNGVSSFSIGSDFTELGTYAVAAAISRGQIECLNCTTKDLEPITYFLGKMGVSFKEKAVGSVVVSASNISPVEILKVRPWPGFPADLMSVAIVLATQAKGVSLMHDWMYESRMFFVDKLISMGANITIADPHRVLVYGPTKLVGRELESPDIRAGMALLLAALVASGTSVINKAELIERGYENVIEKLNSLGAKIQRIE